MYDKSAGFPGGKQAPILSVNQLHYEQYSGRLITRIYFFILSSSLYII